MIAADTSVIIDYFNGVDNPSTEKLDEILISHSLVLPPVVIAELFSDALLPAKFMNKISELPILESVEGYWQRAGKTRAALISRKLKVRLADTLIAQSCIDHKTQLLTSDTDFRHFAKHCELILF